MAEGINDFLNRFFLASGTIRRLPDGCFSKASFRGWVGSYNICLAFLFCAALYILYWTGVSVKPDNVYRQFNDFNHFKQKGCKQQLVRTLL